MASIYDAHTTDPPLLKKHSSLIKVETARYIYPSVRVFFRRHEQEDQMPVDPAPLPLLVFVHGLGGSVAQFDGLLTRMSNCASCLAVDMPGCGRSTFAPKDWAAYSFEALVDILEVVIAQYRRPEQSVVLIGHSMGCSLAALLASRQSPKESPCTGLVAICPPAGLDDRTKIAIFKTLLWIPTSIFDMWRAWDARGGPNSASVRRFVGRDADEESKTLQAKFNWQSKSAVWRRMAWGSLPAFDAAGAQVSGLSGKAVWESLQLPVCLIAGDGDHITPPAEAKKVCSFLHASSVIPAASAADADIDTPTTVPSTAAATLPAVPATAGAVNGDASAVKPPDIDDIADEDFLPRPATSTPDDDETPTTPRGAADKIDIPVLRRHPPKFVESHVLPAPAGHAMIYTPATIGVVSGIVANFLARHVTGRLDRGWQLRFLSREGKWDVKNLEKWSKVEPVSKPIAGIFRAMKTLRQVDEVHSPRVFVKRWANVVKDVIDISHDNPVYDPRELEAGGIHYHKFPTVSKIPPTDAEVEVFHALVEKLQAKQRKKKKQALAERSTSASEETAASDAETGYLIGVHCHYGFNRTGYFIVCHLVDRCNYELSQAIKTFAECRPVGIRHSHFLDALSLRYSGVTDDA
ncbi:dual specificity phosphatase catalytic domain protein [Sporothrix brasiliensis 5110]|uniref:Dual specificity phosphatase catalytic domain protein n=1 Tax=Sporothrix brasiliensis 5110 TaxID=1398154 RepID=A0A0C2FNW9_9PEZI|nr:dual specificity phosphatase catalytic domain protein [Sporothrix brasiliensis 5110]KIH92718.1 dual specificity phosphatase catalytic domain protein [Sporothrix brasiliensis 5110]